MATAALDLNDAALTLAAGGRVLAVEPGFAAASGELGTAARLAAGASSRHWRDLDDAPLAKPLGAWRAAADIVHAQLARFRALLPPGCEAVVAAVPSGWSTRQLGLFLGIARDAGLPLAGLVDAAVAASRRPAPGRELWHLELTLHDAGLTRIGQEDGARRDSWQRLDGLSLQALERACVRVISAAFLRESRFDPCHDAASERQLREKLPGWLEALRGRRQLACTIDFRGSGFRACLDAAELHAALAQAGEPLVQRLRAQLPAGAGAVLQLPDQLAGYPGLPEALARLPGWQVIVLEPGAAALGALRLAPAAGTGPLVLVTHLPWDGPALELPADAGVMAAAALPTHLCFGERAFRLDDGPFRIGAELADGDYGLRLPGALQGVSRRHCSLGLEGGRLLLHDHSRYGTRLNGVRIEGAAVLHAGDRIQIGEPPLELRLVAEEGRHGTAT